jgi:hypothetical protein
LSAVRTFGELLLQGDTVAIDDDFRAFGLACLP